MWTRWVLIGISITVLTSCGPGRPPESDLRGTLLLDPWEKPDFSLTDTNGKNFDFQTGTEGFVTFLFFGYTYCPDICPVHMANLGAVLKRLDPQITGKVKVVFVTTDPERDTPERVRDWLNTFDPSFVGLLGSLDSVNVIQQRVGLPPAVLIEADGTDASYTVGHAASVVAYTTDDKAHVMYPFGTRQEDWAHDIPLLVRGER
jgi:protein SCO1